MQWIILLVILSALLYGPQWWARYTFRRYSKEGPLQGTGAELVTHLRNRFELIGLQVETTTQGDHYDPEKRVVRLLQEHFDGCDLTSVTIAAHEFGHAMQDAEGMAGLKWRTRLIKFAVVAEKVGAIFIVAAPVLALITRVPASGVLMFLIAMISMGSATLVHLITLPVEFDASFKRALPILEAGYLSPEQIKGARRILRAAALTYVSASLAGLLNLARWISLLRGR